MGVPAHFFYIMVPASWKLYAGKFFGNYMLRIPVVFEGGILVKCYGIILRFKGMVSY